MTNLFGFAFGRARAWLMLSLMALLTVAAMGSARAQDAKPFTEAELDQMLAPIALYPDSLLSQVLMASTYPADVKSAAEWTKAHPDAKGEEAVKQVESQPWDPSVQSLVAFPQVITMMGSKPDDVQRLGDAFLEDSGRVMDRVQFLRKKAQEAGNLKSNEQQKVTTTTENSKEVIVVEPAQPNQIQVPVYQPATVYGPWMYPSYPPYYWPPPPYYYPGAAFVSGVVWGAAIVGIGNCLWGGIGWGNNNVNINVNKYNNVNVNNRISNSNFQHNSARRGDVPYRDNKSRDQFGKKQLPGSQDRQNYRGHDGRDAERARANETLKDRGADPAAGRERLQGADRDRANAAARDTAGRTGGGGAGVADRGGAGAGSGGRAGGGSHDFNRPSTGGGHSSALSGARDSGASRANASRGASSRGGMHGGGGARGGGGGGGRRR